MLIIPVCLIGRMGVQASRTQRLLSKVLVARASGGMCAQLRKAREHGAMLVVSDLTMTQLKRRWASRAQTQCFEMHLSDPMTLKCLGTLPLDMYRGGFGVQCAARQHWKKIRMCDLLRTIATPVLLCYA